MSTDPEPAAPPPALPGLRAAASAPAKCILLGEHAVVFGEPCLTVALDRRTRVVAHRVGDRFTVNGYPIARRHHGYIQEAIAAAWPDGEPVRFEVNTDIPSASGTGSSAALSVATVAALRRLDSKWDPADLATRAFRAERATQGAGSPNDTSVSVAGGAVLLAPERHNEKGLRHLWTISHGDRTWEVHRTEVPGLGLVVGNTGVKARTGDQVAKVARFVERSTFGRDAVRTVGGLVWEALDALRDEDLPRLGRLMDRCQDQLHTMGVNHPRLQALIEAVRQAPGTLGAKLTGAGGGGSMVVLTADVPAATRAIANAGGEAIPVATSNHGVCAEPGLEWEDGAPGPGAAPEGDAAKPRDPAIRSGAGAA